MFLCVRVCVCVHVYEQLYMDIIFPYYAVMEVVLPHLKYILLFYSCLLCRIIS